MDLQQPEDHHTQAVEGEAFAIEEMGLSNEAKIDKLLATAVTVRAELHAKTRKIIIGLLLAGVFIAMAIVVAGAVLKGLNDHALRLTEIAKENRENGQIVRENSDIIRSVTSPEAQAKAATATAKAIDDIRRSIDCTKLADEATYPACVEVVARLDAIRAGLDPFTK